MASGFLSVAVPVPLLDLLTYSVPDGVERPPIGARVVVPLGSRIVTGVVVGHTAAAPGGEIKPVREVLDRVPFVPPAVIALAQWTADYYACGVGDAIPLLLPPMARGARVDAHKTRRVAAVTAAGLESARLGGANPHEPALTVRQREALAAVSGTADGVAVAELATRGVSSDTLSRLAKRGYISFRTERVDRDPFRSGSDPGTGTGTDPGTGWGSDPGSAPGLSRGLSPGLTPAFAPFRFGR